MESYKEIFKPISGYEGIYEIGNHGTVRSNLRTITKSNGVKQRLPEKLIKPGVSSNGYLTVSLYSLGLCKSFCIHRLVCEHFVEKVNGMEIVNHIDGVKTNNHYLNLEWTDRAGNEQHAYRIGLKGLASKHHRWKGVVIAKNLQDGAELELNSPKEIADAGFNFGHVSSVISGARKTHKGYVFRRMDNGEPV